MNYTNKHFYKALVLCGLIISIVIVIAALGNQLFTSNLGITGISMAVIFLICSYLMVKNKLVCRYLCDGKKKTSPTYRIEKYILRRWKNQNPIGEEFLSEKLVDTPGRRSRYSEKMKRQAIEKWDRIKRHPNGILLEEFLEAEFGISNGVLNVSKSTFYSWRRKLKESDENSN
jgi:hypothetical protein